MEQIVEILKDCVDCSFASRCQRGDTSRCFKAEGRVLDLRSKEQAVRDRPTHTARMSDGT
ncbi:hypothetical protein LCGC14_0370210 [marine sediment metagenome]|uniref:Uncharacterized protein n=1 Tax=marine sediment metagenome TaxID=412755 RepID=A0A0F9TNM0_9ZZZZ